MAGIYLHIPFCKQACNYCDFHFSTQLSAKDLFVKAIIKELDQRASYLNGKTVHSIYFGGGTPSLLTPFELQQILEAVSFHFVWDKNAELTLEANPDDIDRTKLSEWRTLGINRLSIGLQSFNDEELKWMNRAHTAAESLASVKMAQDAGIENLSIDLIYGSKFQDLMSWENTLTEAIKLQCKHISSYNLTIEHKTALGSNYTKGKEPPVNEDLSSRQFLLMSQMLEDAGFLHYEISNFGKEGFLAQHNSSYWKQQPYLGLGPSAHSFNVNSRQWNIKNNNAYIKAIETGSVYFEREELSLNDRYNEYVLTRLRTIWGCDENEIRDLFGNKIHQHFLKVSSAQADFVISNNGIYTLNKAGKLMADGIAAKLFIA